MDIAALGQSKKAKNLAKGILAGINPNSWHEEKSGDTVDLVGMTTTGVEVRLKFNQPSDGINGKDGFSIHIAHVRRGGEEEGYFIPSDIEDFDREIQIGDKILFSGKLYCVEEIKMVRNTPHYYYHEGPEVLKGSDGVSPSINVKSSTDTEYILTITDATHTFDTPNLKPTIDAATKDYVDDLVSATISRLEGLINQKQNKLVAGSNISISGNVISATGVVVNPDSPSEVVPPVQSNEPTFKLFSAISTDDDIVQETHDTENNLIDMEENLYVKFEDGTQEPDLSIVDDDLHLNTNENINIYIDDNTGDLMLETEG